METIQMSMLMIQIWSQTIEQILLFMIDGLHERFLYFLKLVIY